MRLRKEKVDILFWTLPSGQHLNIYTDHKNMKNVKTQQQPVAAVETKTGRIRPIYQVYPGRERYSSG